MSDAGTPARTSAVRRDLLPAASFVLTARLLRHPASDLQEMPA